MKLEELIGKKDLEIKDLKKILENFNLDMLNEILKEGNISDEEKDYYVGLFNFSIQQRQKKLIEQGTF